MDLKPLKKKDMEPLKRFLKSDGEFKLTKVGSKRESRVGIGQYEVGDFSFFKHEATDTEPEGFGAFITGRGFNFLRTSPIVKIVDFDENSTTFETEGGIYKLEKYVPGQGALD